MSPSWAVEENPWPACEVRTDIANATLTSAAVKVRVSDQGVELRTSSGSLIRRESPILRSGRGWSSRVEVPPDAGFFGLGGRFAPLKPGSSFRLWNSDAGGGYGPGDDPLYITMPVSVCVADETSHLVFYDNTFDGTIGFGEGMTVAFTDGPARAYVAVGSPASVLQRYTDLTGRPPLPPLWALGFHQSRWGYRTEAELRRVVEGFEKYGLPLSALHLDIDHLRGFRTLDLDTRTHPRMAEFARGLSEKGIHLVVSTDPGIKRERGFAPYDEGRAADVFCKTPNGKPFLGLVWSGWSVFPDFTRESVREWWGTQYRRQLVHGIDGFWHDMNEPSSFASDGLLAFPLCVRHKDLGHREAHNVYGLLMDRAGYEGLRKARPDRRPFILTRSGWAGMQKWCWTWTGDVETSWAALRQTIAHVIGLGMCGMPYTGPDVGGFGGTPSPELFVRWFQLSSFLPFFRSHSATWVPRREPWCFGPEVLGILKESLAERYRLLPYWYTLAYLAAKDGAPLVRPLFWSHPESRRLREVDDAFLLGDDILVAPIVEEGATKRDVILPPGEWYQIAGDKPLSGGSRVTLEAPLTGIPVLARAGAIIPTQDGGLVLHAYRRSDGMPCVGALYSDAGDGFGEGLLDSFTLRESGDTLVLESTSQGDFQPPYAGAHLRLHGYTTKRVESKGRIRI